jgi:uncharacterized spore protein YtfJ
MLQATETPISVSPFENVFTSIVDHAGAKMVYGEPIRLETKTVLPVAKVRYGFGGGSGRGKTGDEHGGGGGGGLVAMPVGVVEVTETQTRFVPITTSRAVLAALAIGFCLGLVLSKRRR